jgi:hypothetical protein
MIGAKLPREHSYGKASVPGNRQPGFEAYIGPKASIGDTIGPAVGTLGEGDFTPAKGYTLLLLIEVRAVQRHTWNSNSWHVVLTGDVLPVRTLRVADLHAWLRQQPECVGTDAQLDRDKVVQWVQSNKAMIEAWLEQHSQPELTEFEDTLGSIQLAQ